MDPLQSASFGGWPDMEELSPVVLPAPRDGKVTVAFPAMPEAPRAIPGWISSVVPIPAPAAPVKFPATPPPPESSKHPNHWPGSPTANAPGGSPFGDSWTRGSPDRTLIPQIHGTVVTHSPFPRR